MELVLKGRGERVAGQTRIRVERKVTRLSRLDPTLVRVEIEVIRETRGRIGGGHRAEAACRSGRRTFRASATGPDVNAAVDRLLERVERQIIDHRGRRRARLLEGAGRVKSHGMSASARTTRPGSSPDTSSP